MERFTLASRDNFQEVLAKLRSEYKEVLLVKGRKNAFDKLVASWCSELGAFTYAESIPLIDLILLTSSLENRMLLDSIQDKIDKLSTKEDEEKEKDHAPS